MLSNKGIIILFFFVAIVGLLFLGYYFINQLMKTSQSLLATTTPTEETSYLGKKINVISWIPYWDQQSAYASFQAHANQMQYISLFWYKLNPDGTISPYQSAQEDPAIISFSKQQNVKVLGLIANMADFHEKAQWDADRVGNAIGTSEARRKHIEAIMTLVDQKGFDGIDIDYEALRASQKDEFSLFIEELADALHKKNKILGVAVFPQNATGTQGGGAEAQDLMRLGNAADQLYFMTYLEHGTFSDPGPTASIDYIKNAITYAKDTLHVPPEKIYMGVGLMGVSWRQEQNASPVGEREDIPFQDILTLASQHALQPQWDSVSRSPSLEYTDQYGKHIVWFENNSSIEIRFQLARGLGIGGIALWRLGGEDPAMWQSLQNL